MKTQILIEVAAAIYRSAVAAEQQRQLAWPKKSQERKIDHTADGQWEQHVEHPTDQSIDRWKLPQGNPTG